MTYFHFSKARRELWVGAITLPIIFFFFIQMQSVGATTGYHLYTDYLAAGWQDWSWDVTRSFSDGAAAQSGNGGVSVQYTAAWGGLYLRSTTAVSLANYDTLRFWLHGGSSGNQNIVVKTVNGNDTWGGDYYITAVANSWTLYEIPLADLGSPTELLGIVLQNPVNGSQPTFYLDDISLTNSESTTDPTATPTGEQRLTVDAAAGQHSISPLIYGMNFPDETLAQELELPLARWGGNATTRYNWKIDVSNRASDWYFENIANDVANLAALPAGSASDNFVSQNKQANSASLLTVPLIGWTPKSRTKDCGFSVAKYGSQQATDPWAPDCGNGIASNGSHISGNDPTDTSIAIDETFVQDWVEHLVSQHGTADNGGVQFYNLDNEPMLWSETHRDVHPEPTSYDEIRDRSYQYAAAIKTADPAAQMLGPVVWGWPAYFYSAADGDWWVSSPDRDAHGGMAFLPWYLQEMATYEAQNGVRLLDYLDIHYYPQQNGVALNGAGDAATQTLRLRSTRALWDSSYTDESWINEPVNLIPRMQEWIDSYYPGTKLAISEYNWGGMEHLNGALAQADVLGIFGREGVDLATLWGPPTPDQPGAYAFRMYLNYDGNNGRFGDISVAASSPNQSEVAIYAARRSSDGALLLMVINKTNGAQTLPVLLNNFDAANTAEMYRYSNANLNAIVRQADVAVANNSFDANLAAQSLTLYVIDAGSGTPPTATPEPTNTATPEPTATTQPTGCDILQNGSFEQGNSNWSLSGNTALVGDAYDGTQALQLGKRSGKANQIQAATAGNVYTLSGWFKNDSTAATVGIDFLDGNQSVIESWSLPVPQTAVYSQTNFAPTAPAGTAFVKTWLQKSGNRGYLHADLLTLEQSGGCEPPVEPTNTPVPPTPTNTPVAPSDSLHVTSLAGSSQLSGRNRWDAIVTVTIANSSGQPVQGAIVYGNWSDGASGSSSCTTNSSGTCDLVKSGIRTRTTSVTLTMTTIEQAGYTYDAASNSISSITVLAP